MVQIQGAIYYAAIPYLSEQFSQLQNGQEKHLLIDASSISFIDLA